MLREVDCGNSGVFGEGGSDPSDESIDFLAGYLGICGQKLFVIKIFSMGNASISDNSDTHSFAILSYLRKNVKTVTNIDHSTQIPANW